MKDIQGIFALSFQNILSSFQSLNTNIYFSARGWLQIAALGTDFCFGLIGYSGVLLVSTKIRLHLVSNSMDYEKNGLHGDAGFGTERLFAKVFPKTE